MPGAGGKGEQVSRGILVNKTQLKKVLVAERKTMREKQKQSLWLKRTASIYGGMVKRAAEKKQTLGFTLLEFRTWAAESIGKQCNYCQTFLTTKNFTADHWEPIARDGSFDIANMNIICKPCNWRKGMLDGEQFNSLALWVSEHLLDPEKADFWRRLVIGGKWAGKL